MHLVVRIASRGFYASYPPPSSPIPHPRPYGRGFAVLPVLPDELEPPELLEPPDVLPLGEAVLPPPLLPPRVYPLPRTIRPPDSCERFRTPTGRTVTGDPMYHVPPYALPFPKPYIP